MIVTQDIEARSIPAKATLTGVTEELCFKFEGKERCRSKVCKWVTIFWRNTSSDIDSTDNWGHFLSLEDLQIQCGRSTDKLENLGRKLKLFRSFAFVKKMSLFMLGTLWLKPDQIIQMLLWLIWALLKMKDAILNLILAIISVQILFLIWSLSLFHFVSLLGEL